MNKFSVLLAAVLCMLTVSLSAQSYIGKWKFEFPTDQGTMVMSADIKSDGTYALDVGMDGTIDSTGKHQAAGDQVTISDDSGECTGKGVYKMTVEGDTLTMKRISDACPNRGGPQGVMTAKRV